MSKYEPNIHYCVGCGLCQACSKAEIIVDDKGFYKPLTGDQKWLKGICPIGNLPLEEYYHSSIWGRKEAVYYGWSNNDSLRERASSGGILSEIAIFLLASQVIDGVIHVCANSDKPTENVTTLSYSIDEVINKCGSRYSISHPLNILHKLDNTKRYVFIGKPCDVIALRNYQKLNPDNKRIIPILLSFFCMGQPSKIAQIKLLKALNTDDNNCQQLIYRGNGWPGYATAVNKDGSFEKLDYNSSWGKILGRDLMPACKLCLDGIGEAADISCGDAWYLTEKGTPDFSEHEGRNVVFARTKMGLDILSQMKKANVITLEIIDSPDMYLSQIQKSQYLRRASMKSRIAALKLFRRNVPHYPKEMLKDFSRHLSMKDRLKVFIGTCKRILKGVM